MAPRGNRGNRGNTRHGVLSHDNRTGNTYYPLMPLPITLQTALDAPSLIDDICAHVASGGSPLEFAAVREIPWGVLSNWLRADATRSKRFNDAERDGDRHTVYALLDELKSLSRSDLKDLYDFSGRIKPVSDWPRGLALAVQAVESIETFNEDGELTGYVRKVKLWDKPKSIELLGKYLKLWVERHEHTHSVTLESMVRGSFPGTPNPSPDPANRTVARVGEESKGTPLPAPETTNQIIDIEPLAP